MKKIFWLLVSLNIVPILNCMYSSRAALNAKQMWDLLKNEPAPCLQSFLEENDCSQCINSPDHDGFAPLHYAVKHGAYRKACCLLRHGADIELPTDNGDRAIHIALMNDSAGLTRLLLRGHANPNARSSTGLSPLHAIVAQHETSDTINIYKHLIKHRAAKEEVINGGTPLYFAVAYKRYKFVELLLKDGANPNAPVTVDEPSTILYCAADWGLEPAVKLLISYGANVNHSVDDGWTPLHIATQNNHRTIVKLLLNNQAHINCCTSDQDSALHIAAEHNLDKMALLLLKRGSYPYLLDSSRKTALQLAQDRGNDAVALTIYNWLQNHAGDYSETEDEEL